MKPDWIKIREEWEATKVTFKALAEKHDVKEGTLKSRRSREKWARDATGKDATKSKKKDAPIKRVATVKEVVVQSDELNDKQRLFCIYFNKYLNATKAYQKVYECDYATAQSIAYRLMGNDGIKKEIARLKKERADNLFLQTEDVIQKYIDIAFSDITDFTTFGRKEIEVADEYGNVNNVEVNFVDFKDSSEVDGTIINEVKQGKDGISVKLADKMKALDMLAKYTDYLSTGDRKRLQEEKLKAEIAKSNAELEYLQGDVSDDTHDRMNEYMKAIGKSDVKGVFGDE